MKITHKLAIWPNYGLFFTKAEIAHRDMHRRHDDVAVLCTARLQLPSEIDQASGGLKSADYCRRGGSDQTCISNGKHDNSLEGG
jgi:hypothetical protein